jgi:LPXTG-motif cell wall-anchored protein
MAATILSILMLAGIALLAGGFYLIAKKRDIKRGILMIVAAIVMFGNVAIMSIPVAGPVG